MKHLATLTLPWVNSAQTLAIFHHFDARYVCLTQLI